MVRARGCLILAVAIVAVWASYWALTRNRLAVANESGQDVHSLSVGIGGETIQFGKLAPGATVAAYFSFEHGDVFEVRGRLADGSVVHESAGYVVWEEALFGINAKLKIRPGGALECSH